MNKAFALRLKELREAKRITQQELAKELKSSLSAVIMWENGKRVPAASTLCDIADYFNTSVDFLLGRSTEVPDWAKSGELRNHVMALNLLLGIKPKSEDNK